MHYYDTYRSTMGDFFYSKNKDSAWVPAYTSTHASGRAGQHFKLLNSILGRVKKDTTHNHILRVQYVR